MSAHGVMEQPVRESNLALQPESTTPRRNPVRAALGFAAGSIPTLLVLAGAGAVAWWGHQSGWTVPKFSELTGVVREEDDWCSEHNVPESICVECDPTLMPADESYGWCQVHGVPDCTLEHPDVAELPRTPVVTQADLDRAARALAFAPRPANNPNCRTHLRRIQYVTAADADKSGVAVEPVWTAPAVEFVAAPGEIQYDQTRLAHLSSRSPGSVWRVFKHLGQSVKAGEVLALVDAAEVGRAKAELLQALAALQLRNVTLASVQETGGAVPAARVREADAAVRDAEIRLNAARQALVNLGLPLELAEIKRLPLDRLEARLQFLGIPAAVSATLDPKTATSNLLPLVAPMDGTVSSFEVVAGEVVDRTRVLFTVVDPRSLWLTLDLKGEDARKVEVGQAVRFQPDNGQGEAVGVIAWKSSEADPKTRTVKVRADLAGQDGRLPANTFGSGRVILREEPKVVSVPNEAVQWDGCCSVVFVRDVDYLKPDAPKVFHVRKVRTGAKDGANTEVIAGVLPGELVVTKGSGLLLTELLRGSLGEGCACHAKK